METLLENLKKLSLSKNESDLTLSVRGTYFKCHGSILAARPTLFAAMLRQDKLERTTGIVYIEDCEPEVFQEFLIYLYSGSLENFSYYNALSSYQIANKYDVPEVKAKCVQLLANTLCVKNFCDIVHLALQHNELELFFAAATFYTNNRKAIVVTVNFLDFMKKNPEEVTKLLLKAYEIKPFNTET